MNIIHQLYDETFILPYLKKRVLPLYPDFKTIKKVEIHGIKNHIWEHTYHVVIEYKTYFVTPDGKTKKLLLYCSAHSSEQRKNVYDALKFLWERGFNRGNLTIPHPLFYSQRFRGVFYRGVKGENIYRFIRREEINEVRKLVTLSARWFAKLHRLNVKGARNFNKANSRVETVVPGAKHWLEKIKSHQPEYFKRVQRIFTEINTAEKKFLKNPKHRWLIHGDAHPENVVKMSEQKIGVIDFTDLCLADCARDVGAFIQQIDYMARRHIADHAAIIDFKKVFLETYMNDSRQKLTDEFEARIQTYANWAALRTAVFFLIKEHPEPERADELLHDIEAVT